MQDVKDKAKAFIKRKVEQLTLEHAAVLASHEQQISLLMSARNSAERERDELLAQRDRLREELQASASSTQTASAIPLNRLSEDSSARYPEGLDRLCAELDALRTQLFISQRQHSESVDAASAADAFRQKQLETERARFAAELQEERMRAELALSEARSQYSASLAEAKLAALNLTAADEKVASANEATRIITERNAQLERESRELLQVSSVAWTSPSFAAHPRAHYVDIFVGPSRKRCYGCALC